MQKEKFETDIKAKIDALLKDSVTDVNIEDKQVSMWTDDDVYIKVTKFHIVVKRFDKNVAIEVDEDYFNGVLATAKDSNPPSVSAKEDVMTELHSRLNLDNLGL